MDSREEVLVYRWLLKALELGVVRSFRYQPCTFVLADKATYQDRNKLKTLFQDHVYSPDFEIEIDPALEDLRREFKVLDNGCRILVDVKGSFNRNQRSFSIDQKWVWQKTGFYIYKLEPKKFFRKFGILEEFRFTEKTKKPSKVFEGYPLISEIFDVRR